MKSIYLVEYQIYRDGLFIESGIEEVIHNNRAQAGMQVKTQLERLNPGSKVVIINVV